MNAHEACLAFAKLLRAVVDRTVSPHVAIKQIPQVFDPENVPKTWGSAVYELETWAKDMEDLPVTLHGDVEILHAEKLRRLADRLEERAPRP